MTAGKIYEKALDVLGYSDDAVLQKKAVTILNLVYADLYAASGKKEYSPILSLSANVDFSNETEPAFIYGVAEKLALGEGDGEQQQYFYAMYQKAKTRLTRYEAMIDIFKEDSDA